MGTAWIRIAPGVNAQVEFEDFEYHMQDSEDIPVKLTGNMIANRDVLEDATSVINNA